MVTQVIEKKSRAFQSRLEGIVQDFIYKDKEKERQARYQGKDTYQQESASKTDQDKYSGISDVNDIISQIDITKTESTSGETKTDNSGSSQQAATYSKSDSMSYLHVKSEQTTHDKKTDTSSPGDAARQTPPSKNNLTRKAMQSKRIAKVAGTSPRSSSPSDKSTARAAYTNKHSKTANNENQQISTNEGQNIKTINNPQNNVDCGPHEMVPNFQETGKKKDKDIEKNAGINEREWPGDEPGAIIATHKPKQTDVSSESEGTAEDKSSETKPSSNDKAQDEHKQPLPVESDIEDCVSDVSSVHTSDLSSFDGEVSSLSDLSDHDQPHDKVKKKKKDKSPDMFEETQKAKKNDKGKNKDKNTGPSRKRGRPRKQFYHDDKPVQKESRHHDNINIYDGTQGRDRSKRTIKKKRCYSPSSEGSREVRLPSKRTRVNSRD